MQRVWSILGAVYPYGRRLLASLVAGCLCLAITCVALAADTKADGPAITEGAVSTKPESVITAFNAALLTVMKDADRLGYDGRYAALEHPINATFNVPFMTKVVVGSVWQSWSAEQRDQITDAFRRFILATYARRFDGYSGESFVVSGSRLATGGTLVMSEIRRPKDPSVTLNYLLRDDGTGRYQVVDVFLTGTISELATRRSEFAALLHREGFPGLLAELDKKATSQAAP